MKENKNIELISKNNLRVLNDKNFGLNGKYSWLYSYEDACLFYNYGSCFFSLEQFLNYIHLYVGGLDFDPENPGDFESETKLFKEIFLNKKLEIEDWSYSTIICSACSFVLLNDISSRNEINPASAVSLVGLLFESHLSADINKMLVDWDLFSDHVFFQKSLVFLIGFFEAYPVWGELETLNLQEDNKLKLTFEKLFDLLKIDKNTQKVLLNEVLKSQDCEIVIHFLKNYEIPEKSSLDNFNELIILLDSFEIQNISTHELLTAALTDLESVSVFDLCQSYDNVYIPLALSDPTLATNLFEQYKLILIKYLRFCNKNKLPNLFLGTTIDKYVNSLNENELIELYSKYNKALTPYSVELSFLKEKCKYLLASIALFLVLSINTPPDGTVPPFRSYHTMAGAVSALTTPSFKALALPQISTSRPPISTSRQIKFSTQAISLPQKSGQESISISSNNQIFTAHFYRDGNTIYANTAGLIGTRDSLKNANTLLLKELKNQFPENQGYNVELNKDYQFDHAGHKHNSQAWGIRGSDMSTPTYDQSIGTLIPSSLNKHKNKDYHGCNQGPSLLDSNFVSPGDFYFENGNRYEAGLWEFAEKTGANLNETALSIKGIKASHTKLKTSIEDYFESSEVDQKETLIAGYSETVLHSLNCDANTVVGLKMFPNSGARHVFLNNFTKHALRASKYVRSSINLCQRSSSNYRLSRLKLLSTHETLIILNLKAVVQYQGQIDSNFNVEYWVVRINRLGNKFEKLNRDLLPLEDLHKEALDSGMEVYDVFNGRQGRFIYNRRF